jgi:hypothetical protein
LSENDDSKKGNELNEVEDLKLDKEDLKKKARLRRRGPYRKAHVNW